MAERAGSDLAQALVVANPIPAADELDRGLHDRTLETALDELERRGRSPARTSRPSCSATSTSRPMDAASTPTSLSSSTTPAWPVRSRWRPAGSVSP